MYKRQDKNIISNLEISTYKREVERYGKDFIDSAEKLFSLESSLICEALTRLTNPENYLIFILITIDKYLSLLNHNQKQLFISQNLGLYSKEFSINKETRSILAKKFTNIQIKIYDCLNNKPGFEIHNELVQNHWIKVQEIVAGEDLEYIEPSVLSSLVHMFVNRSFHSQQRACLLYTSPSPRD